MASAKTIEKLQMEKLEMEILILRKPWRSSNFLAVLIPVLIAVVPLAGSVYLAVPKLVEHYIEVKVAASTADLIERAKKIEEITIPKLESLKKEVKRLSAENKRLREKRAAP